MVGWVGGWVGGWLQVHNKATSWPNLQDCKISSRAEISKLDQVWQYTRQNLVIVQTNYRQMGILGGQPIILNV